jgi:hypothetical protein
MTLYNFARGKDKQKRKKRAVIPYYLGAAGTLLGTRQLASNYYKKYYGGKLNLDVDQAILDKASEKAQIPTTKNGKVLSSIKAPDIYNVKRNKRLAYGTLLLGSGLAAGLATKGLINQKDRKSTR